MRAEERLVSKKAFYVALSRVSTGAELITDDASKLARNVARQTGERADALGAVEAACDEGLSKLTTTFAAKFEAIEQYQAALTQHIKATAALPKWFDVFRTETLHFMHHILNENAALRQAIERITATDPEEAAELKVQLDATFQESRRVLQEREADYLSLFEMFETQMIHLRLLEGAEHAQAMAQNKDLEIEQEFEHEH